MHQSSMENMRRCLDWYSPAAPYTVVDLGSADVNGGYRSFFGPSIEYVGADLQAGPNVDVVMGDPYQLPFASESVDVVISGQMLEHCPHFWKVFTEIERILKPQGRAFLIAPSAGPIHRYPVDCYRFYPDAWAAVAEWANLRLVHCWHDDRGPWQDLVGVFQKGGVMEPVSEPPAISGTHPAVPSSICADAERTAGSRSYLEVLACLHEIMKPDVYLEIGVRQGASLRLSRSRRTFAIDPWPDIDPKMDHVELFRCTSDDFFFFHASKTDVAGIQLAFIDGMHKCEYVYRDFINVERLMAPGGLIVIDDVLPVHPVQARRERQSRHWTGDVWKFVELLRHHRKDLTLTLLDTKPSGLLLIGGLEPNNSLLRDNYNPWVRALLAKPDEEAPAEIIQRLGALEPTNEAIERAVGRR